MSCRELDAFLHPYLDGEFDAGERTEFEHHLSTCAPCAAAVAQERALRQKVREAMSRAPAAPAQLRASIQQGLGRTQRQLTLGLWMRAGGWMAAAAAMVGGVVFYSRQDSGRRYLEEAAVRHARGLPVEIHSTTPEGVEAWFGGKLLHRVPVPRFPNTVLAGARLSNVTDKEAAYISYETDTPGNARRRMGLFVFHDGAERVKARPLPAVQVANTHGYNVAVWREGEIVYELVTDLDEHDIRRMLGQRAPHEGVPTPVSPNVQIQPAAFQP